MFTSIKQNEIQVCTTRVLSIDRIAAGENDGRVGVRACARGAVTERVQREGAVVQVIEPLAIRDHPRLPACSPPVYLRHACKRPGDYLPVTQNSAAGAPRPRGHGG